MTCEGFMGRFLQLYNNAQSSLNFDNEVALEQIECLNLRGCVSVTDESRSCKQSVVIPKSIYAECEMFEEDGPVRWYRSLAYFKLQYIVQLQIVLYQMDFNRNRKLDVFDVLDMSPQFLQRIETVTRDGVQHLLAKSQRRNEIKRH